VHLSHGLLTAGGDSVIRVDPSTSDRELVSGAGQGAGPVFGELSGAAPGPGDLLFVSDQGNGAILAVDLTTGDRTVVSDGGVGSGPPLDSLAEIAAEPGGTLVAISGARLLRVDPSTGDRSVVSGGGVGAGTEFFAPTALDVNDTGEIFVADVWAGVDGGVLRVDPSSGDRELITPVGQSLEFASAIAVVPGKKVPALSPLVRVLLGAVVTTIAFMRLRHRMGRG